MPEGDTVFATARRLTEALGGVTSRARGAAASSTVHCGPRGSGAGGGPFRRQAPVPAVRPRAEPPLPPRHGRLLEDLRPVPACARQPPDPRAARAPRTRSRSARASSRWRWCPLRTNSGSSTTSARTCWPRGGPTSSPPPRPTVSPSTPRGSWGSRCSTSGSWPASATCTRPSCASCSASRRGHRCRPWTRPKTVSAGAETVAVQRVAHDPEHHRRPAARSRAVGLRPQDVPALRHARRRDAAGRRSARAGRLLLPALPARAGTDLGQVAQPGVHAV